jgi:hypothetical protein
MFDVCFCVSGQADVVVEKRELGKGHAKGWALWKSRFRVLPAKRALKMRG